MYTYAKVIVKGSPITKSNFKLHNANGRAILPYNTGKYTDRYALYEQEIAYNARVQNPDVVLDESLIAILKVYYKSEKRHPDTINITKSIFDGIEKSGLIVNDAQITEIITQEFYDKENPRFELELFALSEYSLDYTINKRNKQLEKKIYSPIKKNIIKPKDIKPKNIDINNSDIKKCSICGKILKDSNYVTADKGTRIICKDCFSKLF